MKAVKGQKEEGNTTPQREIQTAVREIPIEKEVKGSFSDVLADLEQILEDAKSGKRELPSLRSAAFEAAKRHGLGRDATYNRLVITTAREEFGTKVKTRAETLHDEWMAIQVESGQYHGGKRGRKPMAAYKDKPDSRQDAGRKFQSTLWFKQQDWAREKLLNMFASDGGGTIWFERRLNEDERKQLVLWLDRNSTNEERTRFHSAFIETANKDYGMHWAPPIREKSRGKGGKARVKSEKVPDFKVYGIGEDEQDY